MRIPVPVVAVLATVALVASACSGNNPTPPLVGAAGWSWSPGLAGGHPLPVLWWGSTTPSVLPLLDGGDCAASGSVQGLVAEAGTPLAVGISVACAGESPVMRPVLWVDGQLRALDLPAGRTQGTALAVVSQPAQTKIAIPDRFVGGATGTAWPLPTLWKNGAVVASDPLDLLPPDHDAGMVTSITATDQYVLAAGVAHRTGSSPPAYSAVVWLFDLNFTASTWDFLPSPSGAGVGGWVSMLLDEATDIWSTTAIVGPSALPKPVVWTNDVAEPPFGVDFATAPWASPTGLALVGLVPYSSGWAWTATSNALPQPAVWAGSILSILPSADPASPLGAGEGIAIHLGSAFVVGETCKADPADGARKISVPALWSNGDRTDLATLAAPGAGPAISGPLFGWWQVPPATTVEPPQDWPYPGGTGEVLGSRPISAAGSGVARAVVAVPPTN